MGSKFLESGDATDLSSLQDGSFDAYLGSIRIDDTTPNQTVRINADKKLVSSLIEQSDLNFSVLTNPNPSNLVSDGVEVTTGNVLKANTVQPTSGNDINLDTPTGSTLTRVLQTETISSASSSITIGKNISMAGNSILNANNIEVDNLFVAGGTQIQVNNDLDLNTNDIVGVGTVTTTNLSGTTMTGNLTMNDNNIESCIQAGINVIAPYGSTTLSVDGNLNLVNLTNKNIDGVNDITLSGITARLPATAVDFNSDIFMRDNDITKVANLNVNTVTANTLASVTFNSDATFNNPVTHNANVDLFSNDIASVGDVRMTSFSSTDFKSNDVDVDANLDLLGTRNIKNCLDMSSNTVNSNTVSTGTLNGGISPTITVGAGLDLQTTQDISNIRSMTITSTQYISRIEDMGTPVGNYYVIPDNTTWIILGQITLEYGIEFGANCSLRGIDFSAQITFDETSRDCDIKAVDNNFYLSQITIVNGGGRFTGTPASVRGLLNAQNYNVGAPAPFYGRNKRFKVTDCNILRAFKIGTVEGFGTLNVTNNFLNGGGGLAGQATSYYTNEGLSVSDGLSLEFNNNKMVLMLGAQQASTLKLLNMKARVSSLLGFNAVTITGNIFHPRSTETGVDFDTDSRTALGNISGNVFIRTGGTAPLINYTDQTNYNNYNPLSIENYSINANTGVVDSEPNLKSAIGTSNGVTAVNPSRTEATPTDNAQVLQIDSSARFAVQLDLTGVTVAFVANERITDTASGNTALILAVDAEAGGNQTVYITDMSGTFNATASVFSSATGNATGGTLTFRYRYSEKDPRKLVTNATITISTGNNEQYFVAPGNGVADANCEVSGIANNAGVGGTISLSCTRVFAEGDIIDFFLSSAGGSSTSIDKGIINIK